MPSASTPAPRISVVMPAYNVASCIETALRSALRQTETDLEIVVVDDGSKDGTCAVAERVAAEDARIRVCQTPRNGGRMMACNYGMQQARGEWIAVLDADDWYAPDRLRRLVAAAEAAKVDLVADDWVAVDSKAKLLLESPLPRRQADERLDLDVFLRHSDVTAKADYGMLKHVVRADFVRRHGIEYPPSARTGEDFYFLLSFFVAGGKGLLVREPGYFYVEPFGTVSRQWAQAGRKPYPFDIIVAVNNEFLNRYAGVLTPEQRRRLAARTDGSRALLTTTRLRDALAERRYGAAAAQLAGAPASFWRLAGHRLAERLRSRVLGQRRKVLGPLEPGLIND